jgi:hypothetical protein
LGGVGVTVESIDSSTVSWLALTAMILWLEEGPIKAAPRPSRPATRRHGGTCSSDEEDQLRLDLMRQVRPQCGFNHPKTSARRRARRRACCRRRRLRACPRHVPRSLRTLARHTRHLAAGCASDRGHPAPARGVQSVRAPLASLWSKNCS